MKKLRSFQVCCLILTVWIQVGCQVKRPNTVLDESQMEELLYDYHMAQALTEDLSYTENYKRALYMEAVFRKHGTTEADFDSSLVWYTRNTEELAKIYKKVSLRFKKQRDEINHLIALRDQKKKETSPGDSIDVWMEERLNLLTGMPLENRLTFAITSDSNFKKRDTLVWEVRYQFLESKRDSAHVAIMAMQILYENDSVISQVKRVTHSGKEQIRLYADTIGLFKEVRGFIYYATAKRPCALLTDQIRLMRYHCTDTLSAAAKDTLQADSLKRESSDSLRSGRERDSIQRKGQLRLRPDELNRPSDDKNRTIRPEQIETEQHIQQERLQNQRRNTRRSTAVPGRRVN